MIEINQRITAADRKPDIIALSEVKPKNYREPPTLAQYLIPGYDCEPLNIDNDVGRGMLLYVHSSFSYTSFDLNLLMGENMANEAQAIVFNLDFGETLLFVSVYRSPS